MTKSIRKDKNVYIDGLGAEAEQAAYNGNMKHIYAIIKKLSGKYSKPEQPIKDKEGKAITELVQQMKRWSEHFEELQEKTSILAATSAQVGLINQQGEDQNS